MATFLLFWERLGFVTNESDNIENWHDCHITFTGPLHKAWKNARDYVQIIKTDPSYGTTRKYRIYKLVEVII